MKFGIFAGPSNSIGCLRFSVLIEYHVNFNPFEPKTCYANGRKNQKAGSGLKISGLKKSSWAFD
jgi:hypothetical protein